MAEKYLNHWFSNVDLKLAQIMSLWLLLHISAINAIYTKGTNMQTFVNRVNHLMIPNNITPDKNLLTDLFGLSNILWDHFRNTSSRRVRLWLNRRKAKNEFWDTILPILRFSYLARFSNYSDSSDYTILPETSALHMKYISFFNPLAETSALHMNISCS